jgi:thiamine transporter ThiT
MKKKNITIKITLTSLFIALAYILPFFTGNIPQIGSMLCPMHLPIIICGFLCGWKYGLLAGIVTPILRSLTIGMPNIYPTAITMALELGCYGFISGFIFSIFKKHNKINILTIYISLITALILGRVIWGLSNYILTLIDHTFDFSFKLFLAGAFINAYPGIVLQLILIPPFIILFTKLDILKK